MRRTILVASLFILATLTARASTMVASYYPAKGAAVAAYKTLPFGTRLQLTNPRNGRSTMVVIHDRGPFIRGRSLDVSTQAAQKLGMIGSGVVPLRVVMVGRR